ncbi:hypothetical protein T4E_7964 [Trichinella pseudospiralis]|uniref:Uncharacterized protein n=1 Tax=Trichinella pseudospiralis TaxID=6337 RepID=A0A0V0YM78_TRIPS|nr:hypothetical protein T4E_7964 [Trichinella pseudospiralis]
MRPPVAGKLQTPVLIKKNLYPLSGGVFDPTVSGGVSFLQSYYNRYFCTADLFWQTKLLI